MKRFATLALLAALPLGSLSFTPQAQAKASSQARASTPRTISDYFRLLPIEYTDIAARELLDSARVDEANDYIEASVGDLGMTLKMALFRHKGRVLVALSGDAAAGYSFDLLRFEGGRWKNVTRALMPRHGKRTFYEIPRHGTTIGVFKGISQPGESDGPLERGEHLYDLAWRNGKFSIRR